MAWIVLYELCYELLVVVPLERERLSVQKGLLRYEFSK
jgi:hypothetical protein